MHALADPSQHERHALNLVEKDGRWCIERIDKAGKVGKVAHCWAASCCFRSVGAVDANLSQRLSIPKREQNPRAPDAHLPAAVGNVDTKRSGNLVAGVAQRGPVV